ncbi:glycoside hydrolase [Testicularia cyperi]|uniref:Glycoside hydrolase n=1 Tax=Testicularia cyperi TaxID=1882483 RepID=A0A317XRT2_9BASI|nr:glycoside hydrolase [Testicularia cyperi]
MLSSSPDGGAERGFGYTEKPKSRWGRLTRTKKLLILGAIALALLALILGLALGLTVGKKAKEDENPDSDFVPNNVGGNRTSLLTSGYWYTAPENGTNFNWTRADAGLGAYRADSQGVDIIIDTSQRYQQIDGFGAALTDSAAYLLMRTKNRQPVLYNRLMDFLFNNATGLQVTRVTMGSSDFSVNSAYSYLDNGPTFSQASSQLNNVNSLLSGFSIDNTETSMYVIPVLLDALKRNPDLKVVLSPWSPPAFMKSNDTLNGGTLRDGFVPALAAYYARTAEAFDSAGITPWAMTLQNEPSNVASYPSMGMNSSVQSELAGQLKGALARVNLNSVQVWAHDDNYSGYAGAADIVNANASAVDGVAFHCYRGDPSEIANFTSSLRSGNSKNIYMTECTGTGAPNDRWEGIQAWLRRVYWPVIRQNSRTVLQWNLALDSGYAPRLSTSYCSSCTGSLTLSSNRNPANPYVTYNDQFYLTSHFAGATTDLTNVGGGQAVRVATSQGSQYSLQRSDWDCLNWETYAAPINGTSLNDPSTTSDSPTRRISLVIANTCSDTKNVVISSDGRRSTFPVQQGLTTFVWTSP